MNVIAHSALLMTCFMTLGDYLVLFRFLHKKTKKQTTNQPALPTQNDSRGILRLSYRVF